MAPNMATPVSRPARVARLKFRSFEQVQRDDGLDGAALLKDERDGGDNSDADQGQDDGVCPVVLAAAPGGEEHQGGGG